MDASKRAINKAFRKTDNSFLWPICGKFNVTERAIRKLRRLDSSLQGLEYILALEAECSRIVNNEKNW